MTVRERIENQEASVLSQNAALAINTRGRMEKVPECDFRTCYQRDRDRILHSKAFRRLKHKTQVFLAPEGDHYRTRLTHTLEVSQIARTIARGLNLNEDLTEAISLGHDLGHTPFGHAGERTLDSISSFGFKHYLQSVRVVDHLENDYKGLNLTYEVRNGIACHTTGQQADTLEGRIVRMADKIAYMNHDIEDAITAGVLSESDIPWDVSYVLGRKKGQRIGTLVSSVIENSKDDICMDEETSKAFSALHSFMFDSVYTNKTAKSQESKAQQMVKILFEYYMSNPDHLPSSFDTIKENEGVERAVCDYIAGMSDRFAVSVFEDLFIPTSWKY